MGWTVACAARHRSRGVPAGGSGTDKPESCSARCTIIQCEKRKQGGFRFCHECEDYPCAFIQERENRYQTQYPLKESSLTNLETIRI